jgi:putative transcription factor
MEEATCEICGRKNVKAVVSIEGAKLVVCGACARGKKVLYFLEEEAEGPQVREMPRGKAEETEEIIEGYGRTIRNARQKMGLAVAVVAERINERESYLEHIEREELVPTFKVARKLEKELGIKLIEKVQPSVSATTEKKGEFREPTLGDILESQKKEGK